ncbi:hypothetical protein EYF80_024237 [Liparis tanakae]|uniref:Uncharacterized protein n=1 Tax=Liparis tanakae TaxID=230148 RepID=A0A4Z2HI27_9TELE|nr:hypothetical protein EYF80_024237 [Liparis tanakae]
MSGVSGASKLTQLSVSSLPLLFLLLLLLLDVNLLDDLLKRRAEAVLICSPISLLLALLLLLLLLLHFRVGLFYSRLEVGAESVQRSAAAVLSARSGRPRKKHVIGPSETANAVAVAVVLLVTGFRYCLSCSTIVSIKYSTGRRGNKNQFGVEKMLLVRLHV